MSDEDRALLDDPFILELFRSEVETHTAALNQGLLALEGNPTLAEEQERVMRAAHSLKGAGRIVQLDQAVELAGGMEDLLVAAQRGELTLNRRHFDLLLKAADRLTRIGKLARVETGEALLALEDHTLSLAQDLREARSAPAAISAAPPSPSAKPPSPSEDRPPSPPPGPSLLGDPSMLELFRMEAQSHTATLSRGLLSLEQRPEALDVLEDLMRAAHSIKGAARIVKLDMAVKVAHTMEDIFQASQRRELVLAPGQIDVLLRGADLLGRIGKLAALETQGQLFALEGEVESLVTCLEAVREGREGSMAEAAAPVAETVAPPCPATSAEAVRVSAENLNRIIDLTGESLVKARRLMPLLESFLDLKRYPAAIAARLDRLQEALDMEHPDHQRLVMEIQGELGRWRSDLARQVSGFQDLAFAFENLSDRLHLTALRSRMRPFADGVGAFPRMVRDIARRLGKSVQLEILGQTVQVDRDILERLEAPLTHMLRNALDHGLEIEAERLQANKPAEGRLVLEARHRNGLLYITLSDDGRGIDLEDLRGRVLAKGLVTRDIASRLSMNELLEFIFLPGFTTTKEITELSGRGVGLDVVRSMVQEVGGQVWATTALTQGTTIHLQLPVTLSVVRTLLVEIGQEPYAIRLTQIKHCLKLEREAVRALEGRRFFDLAGENVALVETWQILKLPTPEPTDQLSLVVLSDGHQSFGLVVDRFVGECDLVVRPLDPRLGKVPSIAAASIKEDGLPVLILDMDDITRFIEAELSGGRLGRADALGQAVGATATKRILVVDDSITVREVERKLLENRGYKVDVAMDGMDGWNALTQGHYDLVISDVDMPRMNGIELVAKIRADERYAKVPVVIVSYKDRQEDRRLGLEVGASYYLTKSSFHDEALVQAVVDLIGEAGR